MKTKAVSKLHPWKEIRQPRGIRFTDSEWDAIMKAARAAKTTPSDWLRGLAAKALGTLTLLVVLFASCGGRTDLLEEDDVGGKQPLWIPLAGGVATDIDDKLVPVGRALDITNMQIDQQGKLVKRFGHTQASTSGLTSSWQLAGYKGAQVNLGDIAASPSLSIYSPNKGAWTSPATERRAPLNVALKRIATNGGSNPRGAVGAGYIYVLYGDNQQPVFMHFDVIDPSTFKTVSSQTISVATPSGYDVVFCNGFAIAVIGNTGGVGVTFHTMTPSTLAIVPTTFAATLIDGAFDVIVKDASTISVVYSDGAHNGAGVDFVPATAGTTGWALKDATAASIPLDEVTSWVRDLGGSGKLAIATVSTAQGVRVQWDIPAAGATRQATTTYNIEAAGLFAANITAHTTAATATGAFQVLYTVFGAGGVNTLNVTKMGTRSSGGVLTAGFPLYRSLSLLSRAFTVNGGDVFALFSFASTTDGNSYVMRIPPVVAQPTLSAPQAIFAAGLSGNLTSLSNLNFGLTSVIDVGSSKVAAIAVINRLGRQASGSYSTNSQGAVLASMSFISKFDPTSTGRPVEAVDGLIVPGGSIGHFDGLQYGELGFAYAPPADSATLTVGAGGAMTPSATYWYVFVFARPDSQGRLWRSGTSIPKSVVLGAGNNSVTVGAPTDRVTGYSGVMVEIYRGAANDAVLFQKVGEVFNSLITDTVSFNDTFSDVQLATGEDLYTTGDILNNDTIPGSPFVFTFQGRLCFISGDDPTQLWFSNIITPKNGVRFSAQNVVSFSDERGGLYGAAAMDDKVIAFKQSAVYAFSGEGPDDAGNGSFSTPQLIALGVGSTQPRSIVPDKDGIYFMSTARQPGIQKVSRGLSLAQDKQGMGFGGAVQRYATETIMSAVLVPEQSQARFYCQSGRVLVYDLVAQLWTTFQLNLAGDQLLSAIALNGAALIASNGFNLFAEDTAGATYFDGNSIQGIYTVTITTPWIEFSAIKGFGRLSELIGTGKTVADHTLNASMYTDFDDNTIVNAKSWAETVALTPRWNWEWIPRVQRMSAAKITLSETSTAAGFQVEGITAWVGIKPGLARQPTTTRGP